MVSLKKETSREHLFLRRVALNSPRVLVMELSTLSLDYYLVFSRKFTCEYASTLSNIENNNLYILKIIMLSFEYQLKSRAVTVIALKPQIFCFCFFSFYFNFLIINSPNLNFIPSFFTYNTFHLPIHFISLKQCALMINL